MTADSNLFCPECGVYFTKHFKESPNCSFTLHSVGDEEFGWMPKDQSPVVLPAVASKETPQKGRTSDD